LKKTSFMKYLELFLESSSLLWNVEKYKQKKKKKKIKKKKKKKKKITFKRNNMEKILKPCCPSTHKLKENRRLQMNKIAK